MSKCNKYEHIFNYLDEDGDGKISSLELQRCIGPISGEVLLEDVQLMVDSIDADEDGLLGLDDFVGLMESECEEDEVTDLRLAFGMYREMDGCDQCITPNSLKRMLSRLGESRTIDECVVMINRFDLNGDGVLCFEEFKIMMLI